MSAANSQNITEQQALEQRQKFVNGFNDADGRFFEVGLSQAFLEYGLWQDYGTGRETPRGNSGDLGRAKKRKRRRWFSRKYYASVMRIKEFYEDNIGKTFTGILSNALNKNFGRNL